MSELHSAEFNRVTFVCMATETLFCPSGI